MKLVSMDDWDEATDCQREAELASLGFVAPAEVERQFREFMARAGGGWNEWDQRFLDFILAHAGERFLAGRSADGKAFAVSGPDASGFWILTVREGGTGKGFLSPGEAGRLLAIARERGLAG